MNNELINLITIYFITGLGILVIVLTRTYINDNFFNTRKRRIIKEINCDFMCLSHFIMYILLGYYAPQYWYISFILSILWELLEEYMEKNNIKIYSNVKNDIITNTLGLILGLIIRYS